VRAGVGNGANGAGLMQEWVRESAAHLRMALERARACGWPVKARRSDRLLLGGMGGSAMACDLAACLLEGRIPVQVLRDVEPPAWVRDGTPVGLVSYSGQTWETLEIARAAREAGASIWAVASGGALLSGAGLEPEDTFEVPAGFAPRAAALWLLVPVALAAGRAAGVDLGVALEEAADAIDEELALWAAGEALPGRDPGRIAGEIAGRIAIVYTPSERIRPLGVRWKNQLLENAKQPAYEAAFPELAHNEIMGWKAGSDAGCLVHLLLEDPVAADHRSGRIREAAIHELETQGGRVLRIPGREGSLAVRILSHMVLADQVSIEVAALRGIDPLPVDAIERVKQACGKEQGA